MYCSIEEAWPINQLTNIKNKKELAKDVDENIFKENYNEFKKFISEKEIKAKQNQNLNENMIEHFENRNNKCDNILDHIYNCDECLKKIYKKYNCSVSDNNILSTFITKENKDVVAIVFIGILVILILQLFASLD
jgi:hypothetical protein